MWEAASAKRLIFLLWFPYAVVLCGNGIFRVIIAFFNIRRLYGSILSICLYG